MPSLSFNETELTKQLTRLPKDARLAFGVLCCERMLPNYVAFSNQNNWGNPSVLRDALDACWDKLVHGSFTSDASNLKEQCNQAAPDTEDFQTILASSALDASVATASSIDLARKQNVQDAITIASLARDTIDMYVQELEGLISSDSTLEEQIRLHELMQNELKAQKGDLTRVEGSFDKRSLRDTYRNKGKSNIGLAQ